MKDYTQRGEQASTDYEDVQLDQAACPAQRSGLSSRQLARAATAGLAAPGPRWASTAAGHGGSARRQAAILSNG